MVLLALAAAVTIELASTGGRAAFKVSAVQAPANPAEVFLISVDSPGALPLLGSYQVDSGALMFLPRFPLEPGMRYRAEWKPGGVVRRFEIPRAAAREQSFVQQVHPTSDRLPENLLKFYLHFSQPMSRGEAGRRVRLIDEAGRAVDLPFLEIDEELWDREGRRLTVLFDPGRIKRDVTPNVEVGMALREGRRYTLVIDREWPDATGQPMRDGFRKQITITAADRTAVEPDRWSFRAPAAGTREPLEVSFHESLDHALLGRMLRVLTHTGTLVEGSVDIGPGETTWRFTPRTTWEAGAYLLEANVWLEDLAGNRIGKVFDVDVFERVEKRIEGAVVTKGFRVER